MASNSKPGPSHHQFSGLPTALLPEAANGVWAAPHTGHGPYAGHPAHTDRATHFTYTAPPAPATPRLVIENLDGHTHAAATLFSVCILDEAAPAPLGRA